MSTTMTRPRSMLFMPGAQISMISKIASIGPDLAVVDLEDAVPSAQKSTARAAAVHALATVDLGGVMTFVRVNPPDSPWFDEDLAAVAGLRSIGVVLPKYESSEHVARIRAALGEQARLVVGIESGLGVVRCRQLLTEPVDAVYFGAEDFIADVGGRRTTEGREVLHARSEVLLAASVAGVPAIDQAVIAIRDDDGFTEDAEQGRAIGYHGKICLHPRQVELAHRVFTPTKAEVDHARAVLGAAAEGAGVVDGQMVDEVHVRMATAMIARATEDTDTQRGETHGR